MPLLYLMNKYESSICALSKKNIQRYVIIIQVDYFRRKTNNIEINGIRLRMPLRIFFFFRSVSFLVAKTSQLKASGSVLSFSAFI